MSLRLVLHQTAPRLGAVDENLAAIHQALGTTPPGSLCVFPELSLTGYDLGARARELALEEDAPPPVKSPDAATTVVLGYPEIARDTRLYNVAGAFRGGERILRHRKRYLPTYGMFDEGRIFAPGDQGPRLFHPRPEWPAALLVCEELWHPALAYLAALRGAHLLVVLAAAPGGRGGRPPLWLAPRVAPPGPVHRTDSRGLRGAGEPGGSRGRDRLRGGLSGGGPGWRGGLGGQPPRPGPPRGGLGSREGSQSEAPLRPPPGRGSGPGPA